MRKIIVTLLLPLLLTACGGSGGGSKGGSNEEAREDSITEYFTNQFKEYLSQHEEEYIQVTATAYKNRGNMTKEQLIGFLMSNGVSQEFAREWANKNWGKIKKGATEQTALPDSTVNYQQQEQSTVTKTPDNIPFSEVVEENGEKAVLGWLVECIRRGESIDDFVNCWRGCNRQSVMEYAQAHWEEAKDIYETEKNGGTPKWKGAKTLEELKRKIGGTYWHTFDDNTNFVIQLEFHKNGDRCTIRKSPLNREDWDEFTVDCHYQIDNTPDGNRAKVILGETYGDKVSQSGYSIKFTSEARNAHLWQFTHKIGVLLDKKYKFDHSGSI